MELNKLDKALDGLLKLGNEYTPTQRKKWLKPYKDDSALLFDLYHKLIKVNQYGEAIQVFEDYRAAVKRAAAKKVVANDVKDALQESGEEAVEAVDDLDK